MGSERTLLALIDAAEDGSKPAADALFSALYSELRRLARRELARRGAPISLSATTLLHKAYIEIAGKDGTSFTHRYRFMGYAARVMRGLIIDLVRERRALKRGGAYHITQLPTEVGESEDAPADLARLSDALDELAIRASPRWWI